MTDTKELRRLLETRNASKPKTLLWHFHNNTLKDALGEAVPELLDRLERAEELIQRMKGHTECVDCIVDAAHFLHQKEASK